MFNIEKFHNELALRLGYERIVKDKRIQISVEESDDPVVTFKVQGGEDIRFKASDEALKSESMYMPIEYEDFCLIIDAIHQAYLNANKNIFREIIF